MLIPPMWWDRPRVRPRDGERVVLLHGLWRSWHAMEPLARRLDAEGFSTLNLPYPSSRKPIDWIVRYVRDQTAEFAGGGKVHFVTHSLGGIVMRSLLSQETPLPWQQGRLVMMAPPNGGSEIIDWLSRRPLLVPILGPAARSLASSGIPPRLPAIPEELEAMVIMGNRSSIPFFRRLLDADNDGIVSAAKGRVEGLRGFSIVPADHTFIQIHPQAVRQTLGFLKTGAVDQY